MPKKYYQIIKLCFKKYYQVINIEVM